MKQLILVRHGSIDPERNGLDDVGRRQMSKMAHAIKKLVNGNTVEIISSPANRAIQSSEILATELEVPCEESVWLEPEGNNLSAQEKEEILKLIHTVRVDTLILVTHEPEVRGVSPLFGEEIFGKDIPPELRYCSPSRGEGLLIDCEHKTVVKLP